jgi:hypothetical protein
MCENCVFVFIRHRGFISLLMTCILIVLSLLHQYPWNGTYTSVLGLIRLESFNIFLKSCRFFVLVYISWLCLVLGTGNKDSYICWSSLTIFHVKKKTIQNVIYVIVIKTRWWLPCRNTYLHCDLLEPWLSSQHTCPKRRQNCHHSHFVTIERHYHS